MKIDISNIQNLAVKIPVNDFVDGQFDSDNGVLTTDGLFIFSTPRSGSTMLADLIYKNAICLPHEYFQPFQYLPIMANRWGCVREGHLDKELYLKCLFRYRTYPNGWFGVNLHGKHLKVLRIKLARALQIIFCHF